MNDPSIGFALSVLTDSSVTSRQAASYGLGDVQER